MTSSAVKILLTPLPDADMASAFSWAKAQIGLANLVRLEIDFVDRAMLSAHAEQLAGLFAPVPYSAMISIWSEEIPQGAPEGFSAHYVPVRERLGFGFENEHLGWVPGYKKITFWNAAPELSLDEADRRYAGHIETVRSMQPMWRYRQNLRAAATQCGDFDAASENWWRNSEDLTSNFFLSDQAKADVFEEVSQFLDLRTTRSIVTRNLLLFRQDLGWDDTAALPQAF